MRNMYFTFIYPYLIYCIEVWRNAQHTHLDQLIKIQKKSIRTITSSHYLAHTEPLFDRLNNIKYLKTCYAHNISDNVSKHYLTILPTPLSDLFIVNNTRYAYFTRQHNDSHVDIGLTEGVYKLFSFHDIQYLEPYF